MKHSRRRIYVKSNPYPKNPIHSTVEEQQLSLHTAAVQKCGCDGVEARILIGMNKKVNSTQVVPPFVKRHNKSGEEKVNPHGNHNNGMDAALASGFPVASFRKILCRRTKKKKKFKILKLTSNS